MWNLNQLPDETAGESEMEFVRRIFGAVEPRYLIRAYIFGALFFAFMMALGPKTPFLIIYFLICTALFPFAKMVWDTAMDTMRGNTIFVMPALILIVLKLFINMMLWCFALFVAPIGIFFLNRRIR
ncbi:hypothetical protein [Tardibacter chloracetimidivorans]|uniref:hypothetical protein n=1 Tax=Tardibacter chloracetimidivorans TaxID=1921510 RepID=UPI001300FBFD|nr:hypothetical protein [Tardibacter chloracetimidivorans]